MRQIGPGSSGAVILRLGIDARGRGTFMVQGALSDAGTVRVRRARGAGRLTLTQTLIGTSGALVLRAVQRCGGAFATWRVVRGSGAYVGLEGGGRGTPAPCASRPGPLRAEYRGSVRLPPATAYAVPGSYGGWTSQGERITFEVLAGGRFVANLRVERLVAHCDSSLEVVLEPAFPSSYAISADGAVRASSGGVDLTARFAQGGASGTIAYDTRSAAGTCSSGVATWTARTPPDSLPSGVPGAYCGSTSQNLGVCLTLTSAGRVTRVRVEAVVECTLPEQARFDAVIIFGGLVAIRSNLRFEVHGGIEEGASGDFVLRGAFDSSGAVAGTVSLHRVSVDQEGTVFSCRDALHGWAARRLG